MRAEESSFRDELSCPICYEPLKEAVTLRCGHSFCRDCVTRSWANRDQVCPICKEVSSMEELRKNHTLNNIVAMFLKELQEQKEKDTMCRLHGKELKFFCRDDKEILCTVGLSRKQHEYHRFSTVEEAARDYKEKGMNIEQELNQKLQGFSSMKRTYESILRHNQKESLRIQAQIRKEFEKLHEFLHNEEKTALSDLDEEVQRKKELVGGEIEIILEALEPLKMEIKRLQAEMKENDVAFLRKHQSRKRRIAHTAECPNTIIEGTLIDVARHLGSIQYRACRNMLGSIDVAPFSFDPNTASGWLTVSEDLTSVTNYGYSFLIDTPERFVFGPCILGSTSFSEGSHHWEVNLGNVQSWRVGVSRNIDYHKNAFKHESKTGYWYIYHVDGMSGIWCWVSNSSKTELPLTSPLKRIRVELDCDEGELSFYDTDNNSHLYTFHDNFSLNVFPYFYVGSLQPNAPAESLKICPIKISLQDCPPL